jgi:transcriptional regulator with XRE-family HTH domain
MGKGDLVRQPKKRGRPTKRHILHVQEQYPSFIQDTQEGLVQSPPHLADKAAAYNLEEEQEELLSPFSAFLRQILRRDRVALANVAYELEVAENTIYRWMNNKSDPRPAHLRKLVEILPEHRENLFYVINQTFPGVLNELIVGRRDVQKDIYRQVMELFTTVVEPGVRRWQIMQAIFEYALLRFDPDRQGLAITYAKLMPTHADGIHSLYETAMRGNSPWPFALENSIYLGSTTLAGTAAIHDRPQVWDTLDEGDRLQYEVDDFERSACACPVTHGGRIAGVLIFSSTQPAFFADPIACQSAVEYAQLLALAFPENEFYPFSLLNLRPMPDLKWQREEINRSFVNRVIAYARRMGISRQEAEVVVRMHLEVEFEEIGRNHYERRRAREESLQTRLQ